MAQPRVSGDNEQKIALMRARHEMTLDTHSQRLQKIEATLFDDPSTDSIGLCTSVRDANTKLDSIQKDVTWMKQSLVGKWKAPPWLMKAIYGTLATTLTGAGMMFFWELIKIVLHVP